MTRNIGPGQATATNAPSARKALAIWVGVVLAAVAAAVLVDEGASFGSRLPVLIAIAVSARLVLHLAGTGRTSPTSRQRRFATAVLVALMVAVFVATMVVVL